MSEAVVNSCIHDLSTNGYCRLRQVYEPEQIQKTLELSRYWYEQTKESLASNLPNLAKNDPFVWNPQNKDVHFLRMIFHSPLVERILMHFLNDRWFKQIPQDRPNYILRNLLARSSDKILPMHIDSLIPYVSPHVFVMQVSILLEDQKVANGCTMVVPGSHLSCEYAKQEAFEIAVPAEGEAGDVYIWDSRIWHGAGANSAGGTRWALIGTYCRWWLKQMFNITGTMPQAIYEQLTDSQKAVLGFCSIPNSSERYGIDMKTGYDALPESVAEFRQFERG